MRPSFRRIIKVESHPESCTDRYLSGGTLDIFFVGDDEISMARPAKETKGIITKLNLYLGKMK